MKSDRNYVYTERAHFMCPNMHFGIMEKIESNYDEEQLIQNIDILQKAHPFLQSLIAEEKDTGRIYYQIQDYLRLLQLVEEFARHYTNGVMPQFAPEHLIEDLNDLPQNNDLPFISSSRLFI